MSVNTRILLPSDVRCLDVAEVIGVLAGLPFSESEHGCEIEGLHIESCGGMPGPMVEILLRGLLVDGETEHRVNLHYESCHVVGHDRELMPRSTAFWLAIGRRLIEFFGGAIRYNECDGSGVDEHQSRHFPYPPEDDDDGYSKLKNRILNLKPVTVDEMRSAAAKAYYGWGNS